MQNSIAHQITSQLGERLQTEVSLAQISYKPFNRIRIEELFVQDLNNDTLLFVKQADLKFNFVKFFSGKFIFEKVRLNQFEGKIVIDSTGVSNFSFIIDTFRKPEKKEKTPVEFNFQDILIANSSFQFDNFRKNQHADSLHFDVNHLNFRNINAKFEVKHWQADSLLAIVHSFSAEESSGLKIRKLQTEINGLKKGFFFPSFNMQFPQSTIALDSLRMEYDSIGNLKDIINKVRWSANILPTKIIFDDFVSFNKNFAGLQNSVQLKGSMKGRISSFRINNLSINYENSLVINTDIDLNGIPNLSETFIYARINDFSFNRGVAQDIIARLLRAPFQLPDELSRLGNIKYQGNISGFFSNLVAYGKIKTDAGLLHTDILLRLENNMSDMYYSGHIKSQQFDLGHLLATQSVGKALFKIETKGSKLHNNTLQGTISGDIPEIELNHYAYQNISLDGNYDGSSFEGQMQVIDPNLLVKFNGVADFSDDLPVFNFEAKVDQADLYALKLTNNYENSTLAFHANTNMKGKSLDNLNGYLLFDSIYFTNKEKSTTIDQLLIESEVDGDFSRFSVTSDFLNAHFEGQYRYSTMPTVITSVLQSYLPSISGQNVIKTAFVEPGNHYMSFDITLNNANQLMEVLELPIQLAGTTTASGNIDEQSKELITTIEIPKLSYGKRAFENLQMNIDNKNERLNLLGKGIFHQDDLFFDFSLLTNALNDSVYSQLEWKNRDSIVYAGELQLNSHIRMENNLSSAIVNIIPTQIVLKDSVWDIHASTMLFNPDLSLDIQNFHIQNKEQYIHLDGLVSKKKRDQLQVRMNDIDLSFIVGLFNPRAISISGKASGMANMFGILDQKALEASIQVKHATLNNSLLGDARVYAGWDDLNEELIISGTFFEGTDVVAKANGIYSNKKDSVDFIFDANKLNLGFLQRYLKTIVTNLEAKGTGSVRMFGDVKKIGFEGDVFVQDATLKMGFQNTVYSFSDSIFLARKAILFKDIEIYDTENNKGLLNGLITHNGSFKDMNFDIKINAKNILALDIRSTNNNHFYGKAYGTGNVHIFGNEELTSIDITALTEPGTNIYISPKGASKINDNDFITFVNSVKVSKITTFEKKKHFDVKLAMQLEVTPNANIQLLLNPLSSDIISAVGNGSLRLEHDSDNDLKLYGSYSIEKGNFLFSLQNILRKQFRIEEGSTLTWTGEPERAQLNIKAIHSLTASLYDLMSTDILSSTDRSSIPVECILSLSDELTNPTIAFDVNLPSSDETLKMQVRNLMNTQEMMNRQMAYLLIFGKFYTPDYNRSTADYTMTTNTGISFLTSTLSGQINNWLSQISNNISLGANYRSSGYGSTISQEYEGEIMFQPNNRLVINGNFGYRDDYLSKNKIIGDLDIEYILTENAKWRLKAYNHTVDRYSLRAAPFTQGVGIMYKEDFNNWPQLWRDYKRIVRERKEKTDTINLNQKEMPIDSLKSSPTENVDSE